jgi:hypothetical protein
VEDEGVVVEYRVLKFRRRVVTHQVKRELAVVITQPGDEDKQEAEVVETELRLNQYPLVFAFISLNRS